MSVSTIIGNTDNEIDAARRPHVNIACNSIYAIRSKTGTIDAINANITNLTVSEINGEVPVSEVNSLGTGETLLNPSGAGPAIGVKSLVAGTNVTLSSNTNEVTINVASSSPTFNGFIVTRNGGAVIPITSAGIRPTFDLFYLNQGSLLWDGSLFETESLVAEGDVIRVDFCFNIVTPSTSSIRITFIGVNTNQDYYPAYMIPIGFTGLYYGGGIFRKGNATAEPIACILSDPDNVAEVSMFPSYNFSSWLSMSKLN